MVWCRLEKEEQDLWAVIMQKEEHFFKRPDKEEFLVICRGDTIERENPLIQDMSQRSTSERPWASPVQDNLNKKGLV